MYRKGGRPEPTARQDNNQETRRIDKKKRTGDKRNDNQRTEKEKRTVESVQWNSSWEWAVVR